MSRQPRLAFLVADGARARLVLRHSTGLYETLEERTAASAPRRRHRERTRVFERVGPGRSAVEDESEQDRVRRSFSADLAQLLNEQVAADRIGDFVLVAPAKMIGLVRDALDPAARPRLLRTLAKDLTKLPELELTQRLEHLSLTHVVEAEPDKGDRT